MTELRKEINYAVACVSEFASRYNLSTQDAFQYLYNYKGIEFLKENYEIEHTLSLDDALDDLFIICRNKRYFIMLLYHGSNTDIKSIDLAVCRPYKNFGIGFI